MLEIQVAPPTHAAHGPHRGVAVDVGETGWLYRVGEFGGVSESDKSDVILRHFVDKILE